jgi:hypothetical protein
VVEEYKSNSHKSREEQTVPDKKVEKVISGAARSKKKAGIQKFTDLFFPEDVGDVKSYVLTDVIIPAAKDIISDVVRRVLYGERGARNNSPASKVSYRSFYDKDNNRRDSNGSQRPKSGYSYDDIILDNRGEAEEVLSSMDDLVSRYGLVSVADLYDLVGVTGNYTDNKYGWTDIRNASIIRVRDGYMIKLPKTLPLN